jgi:CheY-like chemotaxis protein
VYTSAPLKPKASLKNQNESLIKKCLLVDDDEDDREIFCLAIQKIDPSMQCVTARDGLDALSILKNETFVPDYIFLDLNMPLMNGKECLREIRKQDRLKEVPVIIVSTSLADKDKEDTKNLGASAFITKPPLVSALASKLLDVLGLPKDGDA